MLEGMHDVNFIARILMANGFNEIRKVEQIKSKDIQNSFKSNQLTIEKFGLPKLPYMIPAKALHQVNETKEVFLYNLEGDAKRQMRHEIYKFYQDLIPVDEEDITDINSSLRFLWFFDADQQGVDARILKVSKECSEFSGQDLSLSQGGLQSSDNIEYGTYIFYDVSKQNKIGKLESQIKRLILMDPDHKQYLELAETYVLQLESLLAHRQNPAKKFDKEKAELGSLSQLQNSGSSNAVFIQDSDFLKKDLLLTERESKIIAQLFVN